MKLSIGKRLYKKYALEHGYRGDLFRWVWNKLGYEIHGLYIVPMWRQHQRQLHSFWHHTILRKPRKPCTIREDIGISVINLKGLKQLQILRNADDEHRQNQANLFKIKE